MSSFLIMVGDTGFEPVTPCVSSKCATAAPIAHYAIFIFQLYERTPIGVWLDLPFRQLSQEL